MIVLYSDVGVKVNVESNGVYLTRVTLDVNRVTTSHGPVCRGNYGRGSSITWPSTILRR